MKTHLTGFMSLLKNRFVVKCPGIRLMEPGFECPLHSTLAPGALGNLPKHFQNPSFLICEMEMTILHTS